MIDQKALAIDKQSDDICILSNMSHSKYSIAQETFSVSNYSHNFDQVYP